MSIGKSAIKRVENNGYSKVKTDAPDMQNSHVIAAPSEEVTKKLVAPIEEKTAKKRGRPATKKKEVKTSGRPATKKKEVKTSGKNGFITCSFGEDLPYYLL